MDIHFHKPVRSGINECLKLQSICLPIARSNDKKATSQDIFRMIDAASRLSRQLIITEAICTEDGSERRDCFYCDHFEIRVIKATGHDYETLVTLPTCVEQGYTTHICANCGDSYVDSYTDALDHGFSNYVSDCNATCTEDGTKTAKCDRCDLTDTILDEGSALGHDMDSWKTVLTATCTTNGEEQRNCSRCNYSESRIVVAVGHHSWDKGIVSREPTEETEGERLYTCTVCGATKTESIPVISHKHSYDTVVTAPTCTEQGYTTHTCHCGDSYVDTYMDALGHMMSPWIVEVNPSCTEVGSELRYCHRYDCDYGETRLIPPTGHNYQEVVTAPTCTEMGCTTYICHCGDSYVDTYLDALGHNLGDWVTVSEASCTEVGEERRECSRCDYYETQVIAAHGHTYEHYMTASTCTEEGFTEYICTDCGDSYVSDYVSPTGHKHEAVITDPTCTEQGYTTYTCHCGDSYVSDYVDALGHDIDEWHTVIEATCTEDGMEQCECSRCDYSESRSLDALGHDWDDGVVTVEPTEETEGVMTYTCRICFEIRTEVIPALEHEHAYVPLVTAPTCTEQGYTTHTCRCGDSYVDDYVDALGHDMGEWYTVTEATCTENGEKQRDCSRCDHFETQAIAAAGHDYHDIVTEPTCTSLGYTTHTCDRCGDSYKDCYVDALGHNFTDYVSDGNASCTQDGTKTAVCDRCDAIDTVIDEGSAHGHDFTEWIVIQEPTVTAEGLEFRYCLICGIEETRSVACMENPFTDVPENSFYYAPVMWAVENAITNGATATTFNPNGTCLRAQVVTFLHRATGNPEPTSTKNPFTDVKFGDFFYKPVLWAVEKGITNGIGTTKFGSYDVCNRAAVVTFLWRTAGCPEPESTSNPFVDVKTTDFFYKPVLWAVENNITNGVDATHFGPTADCNRAQVVTFLYRTFNKQ